MSLWKPRFIHRTAVCLLILLELFSACQQETKTKNTAVPIDTTVVDDDTLEVNDVPKSRQTEHAR